MTYTRRTHRPLLLSECKTKEAWVAAFKAEPFNAREMHCANCLLPSLDARNLFCSVQCVVAWDLHWQLMHSKSA